MRAVYWLCLFSIVLLTASVVLFVKATNATANARVAEQAAPVATVKQVMDGIVQPAAAVVFGSVATISTAGGREDRQPRTESDWAAVGASAAALVEAGNLLMMGERLKDRDQWVTRTRAMMDAAKIALRASEARDVKALFDSGEAINLSCDMCHTRYQMPAAE